MDVARLVLEYVQAIAWPLVVGVSLFAFRKPIAAKLKDLTDVSTPLGGAKFDRDAKAIEEKADRAAARQEAKVEQHRAEPSIPGESRGEAEPAEATPEDGLTEEQRVEEFARAEAEREAWERNQRAFWAVSAAAAELTNPQDFDTALDVATTSPNAAVMLAYSQLEKVARAAWAVSRMDASAPPHNLVSTIRSLINDDPDDEFLQVARDLAELRNRVAHGAGDVSSEGALNFITACEHLTESLSLQAVSRLRHPSRASLLTRWAEWFGGEGP